MPAEVAVRQTPQLSLWSIGAGFEGSASDWTEYIVWLVGFIALVWFVWSRNVMALPDMDPVEFQPVAGPDDDKQD
eukprot:CAMPEP_0171066722 /NCGR_PEP_ID=MMETSP0766_2-20121228/7586_1 /TAXON_ID=439317 /ORGANISM="Gambierdiscus australes, Strain CAWD 149" /LENGTH=74 /DNA_ID=CAMNT_0011522911 /DNA_START=90 /DNA_END=314 /DNA_ORIENTATION=+